MLLRASIRVLHSRVVGGRLPYETDGDARRLAQGVPGKAPIFKPPRSRLGFREETQNYAKRNRSQNFFLTLFVMSLYH